MTAGDAHGASAREELAHGSPRRHVYCEIERERKLTFFRSKCRSLVIWVPYCKFNIISSKKTKNKRGNIRGQRLEPDISKTPQTCSDMTF